MKTPLLPTGWTFIAASLLCMPAAYFIAAALLNFQLGIDWLWEPIAPFIDAAANKRFSWNINAVIVVGPIIACLLSLLSLANICFIKTDSHYKMEIFIKRNLLNIGVLALSFLILAAVIIYLFFENLDSITPTSTLFVYPLNHFLKI